MKLRTIVLSIIVCAGLLCIPPAFAANTIMVNGTAALEGSFGLEVIQDGSTNQTYVQDNSPSTEVCGKILFRIDPNSFPLIPGQEQSVIHGQGSDPGGGTGVFRVNLVLSTGGSYRIRAHARIDDNGPAADWARTNAVTIGDAPRQIQMDWCKATAPMANDGWIRITRVDNGAFEEVTGIDSDQRDWRRTKLGATQLVKPVTGSYYLDDFQAFRGN